MKGVAVLVVLLAVVAWFAGVRLFVVQPIGALPDGVTLIVAGMYKLRPVDSADAVCARLQGGVSLLCRGVVVGAVGEEATILARLPYSDLLFRMTGGPFRAD